MSEREAPLIEGRHDDASITRAVIDVPLAPFGRRFWLGFAAVFALTLGFVYAVAVLFTRGIGIWGVNLPVVWGFAIINYVWWIGIGNAGTLISAMLLLTRQDWRASLNRFAEAMTIFAASIAGLFPILHLGRPEFFYWLVPYPDTMGLWPQWRSPLVWDFFAIASYILVSFLFWYVGLLPDLAATRDRAAPGARKQFYAVLSLGWTGEARAWAHYERAYTLLAGLAVPLVVSVHSVVGFDFAVALVPDWHDPLFAPYFVAGAMFSGFAMVIVLAVVLRAAFHLHDFITATHLDRMGRFVLAGSWMIAYAYLMELFFGWYTDDPYQRDAVLARLVGSGHAAFWATLACNVLVPQLLWFGRLRRNAAALFAVALAVNVGMWLERFVIVTAVQRDFLPSTWGEYVPTRWDWLTLVGSFGLFATLFFLFARLLPLAAQYDIKRLRRRLEPS